MEHGSDKGDAALAMISSLFFNEPVTAYCLGLMYSCHNGMHPHIKVYCTYLATTSFTLPMSDWLHGHERFLCGLVMRPYLGS